MSPEASVRQADLRPPESWRRLIRHARYFVLQLAESYLTRRLFEQILERIDRLAGHPT